MKYIQTYNELNESIVKNQDKHFSSGYHLMAVVEYYDEFDMLGKTKDFKTISTVAIYHDEVLCRVVSLKKSKSLDLLIKLSKGRKLRDYKNHKFISTFIYDADKKEFYRIFNTAEDLQKQKKDTVFGKGGLNSYRSNYTLDMLEWDIYVTSKGHVNDYESMSSSIVIPPEDVDKELAKGNYRHVEALLKIMKPKEWNKKYRDKFIAIIDKEVEGGNYSNIDKVKPYMKPDEWEKKYKEEAKVLKRSSNMFK